MNKFLTTLEFGIKNGKMVPTDGHKQTDSHMSSEGEFAQGTDVDVFAKMRSGGASVLGQERVDG